jgi:hypothetical protein
MRLWLRRATVKAIMFAVSMVFVIISWANQPCTVDLHTEVSRIQNSLIQYEVQYQDSSFSAIMVYDPESEEVGIKLTLEKAGMVGFALFDREDRILHLWDDKLVDPGLNYIVLPLPELEDGRYLLRGLCGDNQTNYVLSIHNGR